MDKKRKIGILFLIVTSVVFILFVVFMQDQFNNPDFNHSSDSTAMASDLTNQQGTTVKNEDVTNNKNEASKEDDKKSSTQHDQDKNEQEKPVNEERVVNADLLNVRSGPSTDHQITDTLTTGDIVTVSDTGAEWLEIQFDDIEGYVNRNFLDPVED